MLKPQGMAEMLGRGRGRELEEGDGSWVRRGGLVAASCCFDPVDSGVGWGTRPFCLFGLLSLFRCDEARTAN